MLGYTTFGTNDLDRAKGFYDALLKPLGGKQLMQLAQGVIYGADRPCFGIMKPFNGEASNPGNGPMTAFVAPTRDLVDAVHAKALELGGKDEGAPGLRGEEANGFYAAYFRDLDGNKLCVFRIGPA